MFVLKYKKDIHTFIENRGKFVAVDNSSGGYPYPVDNYDRAQVFTTIEKAQEYQKHFEYLEIFKLEVRITPYEKEQ